jgi:hypothetical protein
LLVVESTKLQQLRANAFNKLMIADRARARFQSPNATLGERDE